MDPISVNRRHHYGGSTVATKYSPLEDIKFPGDKKKVNTVSCSNILAYRHKLLTMAGLLPQPLNLTLSNWRTVAAAEVGRKPPLVVISTNRANWIKKGLDEGMRLGPFANASELTALRWSKNTSPPIYAPSRMADPEERGVYIVVHASEYNKYKKTLAGTRIEVVGWEFTAPLTHRDKRKMWLTGFGASRYAAISFCKELRIRALFAARVSTKADTSVSNYAWLFDDNVVALGRFAGFEAVEKAMDDADEDNVCAGFHGGTTADSHDEIVAWANSEDKKGHGSQAETLPPSETPDLIQQAVLWNIDYLTENELNVGLVYINSAEDVSLGNYFKLSDPVPCLYYKGIPIYKELASNDSGGLQVTASRDLLTGWLANMESLSPEAAREPPPPPPPIMIESTVTEDGGVQTLSQFVVNHVLPKSSHMKKHAADPNAQNKARCLAVEQLTAEAVAAGCINAATIKLIFSDAGQVVEPISEAGD